MSGFTQWFKWKQPGWHPRYTSPSLRGRQLTKKNRIGAWGRFAAVKKISVEGGKGQHRLADVFYFHLLQ